MRRLAAGPVWSCARTSWTRPLPKACGRRRSCRWFFSHRAVDRWIRLWSERLAAGPGAVLLCGRYEGVDERVIEARRPIEVSLGDFVLAGGEVAALALIEACVRLLPGVIGEPAALVEESFEQGLLEYPHYTRPRLWQGLEVPDALLSGNHGLIAGWRRAQAERLTRERREDLWARHQAAAQTAAGARPVEGTRNGPTCETDQ